MEKNEQERIELSNSEDKSSRLKKAELSKNDNDQMEMRKALIVEKQREMQRLQLEGQIFTKEYQTFVQELYNKYKLDSNKQYTIEQGYIIEVEEEKDDKSSVQKKQD